MRTINPYLTFDGKCEEAFALYKSVFGGEFESFSRFSDMPEDPNFPVSEEMKNLVMHVSLPISAESVLMGSDSGDAKRNPINQGNNFSISVQSDNREETERIFNELSKGGNIRMPLADTFWGAYFGMCTDKYGINWMVNCEVK